jgi:hypothetical protein
MANLQRGEVEIKLRGQAYTLRLTHEGIAAAEVAGGMGLIGISMRVSERKHGFREIAALIFGGLLGGGHKELSFEQVCQAVLEAGVNQMHAQALVLLKVALNGLGTEDAGKNEEPKADPIPT